MSCVCLCCSGRFKDDSQFDDHPCNPLFKMKDGVITTELSEVTKIKRTRLGRFIDMLIAKDIGWTLAFFGLIIMNMVLVSHMNLTFKECLIEGLALGFAIPRLIK